MKKLIVIVFIFIGYTAFGQGVSKKGIVFRELTFDQAIEASKKEGDRKSVV